MFFEPSNRGACSCGILGVLQSQQCGTKGRQLEGQPHQPMLDHPPAACRDGSTHFPQRHGTVRTTHPIPVGVSETVSNHNHTTTQTTEPEIRKYFEIYTEILASWQPAATLDLLNSFATNRFYNFY
jgi:hypothetical protein